MSLGSSCRDQQALIRNGKAGDCICWDLGEPIKWLSLGVACGHRSKGIIYPKPTATERSLQKTACHAAVGWISFCIPTICCITHIGLSLVIAGGHFAVMAMC